MGGGDWKFRYILKVESIWHVEKLVKNIGKQVFKMTPAILPEATTAVITIFIKYGLIEKYMFGKPES